MGLLNRFDPPARLDELAEEHRLAWSAFLAGHTRQFAFVFPQYYDPLVTDSPDDLVATTIVWSAFPARLAHLSDEQRWELAEDDRSEHDEYCEWLTTRDSTGAITKVTFTTEVPEYWEHVAQTDPAQLLARYRELVSADVRRADLFDANGDYLRRNRWNASGGAPGSCTSSRRATPSWRP